MGSIKSLWAIFILLLFISISCSSNREMRKSKANAFRKLGVAHMNETNYAAAFKQFTKAQQLNPDDHHVYFDLGNFYYQKHKYNDAIKEYKKSLKIKPDFGSAKNNLGKTYLAKKEYENAISCFEDLIDNYIYATPHYPLFSIGQAYFLKKDYLSAEKHFKKALEMKSDFDFAMFWLGRTYVETGNAQAAVEILEKAVNKTPQNASGHFELGKAYILLRDLKKAQYAFEMVIALDPESEMAVEAKKAVEKIKIKK